MYHTPSQEARRYFSVDEVPFSLQEENDQQQQEQRGGAGAQRACADVHIFEMRLLSGQGESAVS